MARSHAITVRRQVVDAAVRGSELDGLMVQRHLSGAAEGVVARALEQALDEIAPSDDHLIVDTLEIDLGEVPLVGLDESLAEAVRREVSAFFRRHTPPPSDASPAAARTTNGPLRRRTGAATVEDAFLTFLRTGRIPWSFRTVDGTTLETAVRRGWAEQDSGRGPDAEGWERVRDALDGRTARLRVVKQFSEPFADRLVLGLAPEVAAAMTAVLEPAPVDGPVWTAFGRQVRLAALAAAAERRRTTARGLVGLAVVGLPVAAREDRQLVEHLGRRWPGVVPDATVAGAQHSDSAGGVPASGAVEGPARTAAQAGAAADATPSSLVDQAGLVLLHPFLPRFFEGLGVAGGDGLVDLDKAVALLHHLATGATVVPEQSTTVAKILCGCPLAEPVEREPGLTPSEIAEGWALLEAVIGHWAALRSTSPDALRAEFLARPGALSIDDDGDWVLRVEQRSVDILLEQLPWGISMVRTPWMQRMLRVEWRV